jgi:hypothetical protein
VSPASRPARNQTLIVPATAEILIQAPFPRSESQVRAPGVDEHTHIMALDPAPPTS